MVSVSCRADGKLLAAGVEIDSMFMGNQPAFKIVGSDSSKSDYYGPPLNGDVTLLKSAFNNNFHFLLPTLGGQYLVDTDVASAQYSTDGGLTYLNLPPSSFTINATNYWRPQR